MGDMKIIFGILFASLLLLGCTQPNPPIACPADAKICPDGSAVGRIAPSCEFAPCPSASPSVTIAPTAKATDDIPPLPDEGSFAECKNDADCVPAGCNGEVCIGKEKAGQIASICIYKPEFACYKQINCACIGNVCAWEETPEFLLCIQAATRGGGNNGDLPPLPQ